jgi:hypothetical protein
MNLDQGKASSNGPETCKYCLSSTQIDSLEISALESWLQYASNGVLIVRNGAVLSVKEDGEILQHLYQDSRVETVPPG